jgi:hypothetical protein
MSDDRDETPQPSPRPPDLIGTHKRVDDESLKSTPANTFEGEAFEEYEPAAEPARLSTGDDEPHEYLPERRPEAGAPEVVIPRETEHTPRFQFLLGALLAVGAVALAAAMAVAMRPEPVKIDPAAGWSNWRPAGSNPVTQIAKHVGREYRLPSGRQLVLVTGGPMSFLGLPAKVALQQPPKQGGDISLLGGGGVIFRLCGLGSNCSISEGKPSLERTFLLRREALELALYAFRYIEGVNQVVVFLPPAPGKRGLTVLLRKDQLEAQILRPLNSTLARRTPSVKGVETSPDATNVDRLTHVLYTPQLAQSNADAALFLVLKPFDPKDKSQTTTQPSSGSSGTTSSSTDPSKALTIP